MEIYFSAAAKHFSRAANCLARKKDCFCRMEETISPLVIAGASANARIISGLHLCRKTTGILQEKKLLPKIIGKSF
jgi:hypothetical protein